MILTLTSAAVEGEEEAAASPPPPSTQLPADIDWEMLDKRRFFILGAALFSGVSAVLYPAVLLKTRLQVSSSSAAVTLSSLLRSGGPRALYRGFPASLAGTLPARALYMTALETTKSAASALGVPAPAASAAAGVSAALAAQAVWTPVDVVTQRLMVGNPQYLGGADAVRKIVVSDGLRGLYRGFGVSMMTYAPSNAVWWASYSAAQRAIWRGVSRVRGEGGEGEEAAGWGTVAAVQGASALAAGGAAAVVTMPLDTIKTRMQVMEGGTVGRTVRNLVREGGLAACYRGLAPRWASMSLSAMTMITTYEFLKRLSAKEGCYSSSSSSSICS